MYVALHAHISGGICTYVFVYVYIIDSKAEVIGEGVVCRYHGIYKQQRKNFYVGS